MAARYTGTGTGHWDRDRDIGTGTGTSGTGPGRGRGHMSINKDEHRMIHLIISMKMTHASYKISPNTE